MVGSMRRGALAIVFGEAEAGEVATGEDKASGDFLGAVRAEGHELGEALADFAVWRLNY